MTEKIPKTIADVRFDRFSDLKDEKDISALIDAKVQDDGVRVRKFTWLKLIAIVLIFLVTSYALRGYWLGPIVKSKIETFLSGKFNSVVEIDLVKGNYINHFQLYNVAILDKTNSAESHLSKISIYYSFWSMLKGKNEWIRIIEIEDGKVDFDLSTYLRSRKTLKLPEILPAVNLKNIDLSIDYERHSLKFTDFSCTLWSSGRIIANAAEIQGTFGSVEPAEVSSTASQQTFTKSDFAFDARWTDQKLGIDSMVIAGQNTTKGLIVDFSRSQKKSIIGVIGRLEFGKNLIFIDGSLNLAPSSTNTLSLTECQLVNFDVKSISALIRGFPFTEGSITGLIDGVINLDLFINSNFQYDVEVVNARVNEIDIPLITGFGTFDNGMLKIESGNWIQDYDEQIKRRLQINLLEFDVSEFSEGKISTLNGEIILSSDEQFELLKDIAPAVIPSADYLLKAVFSDNQILVYGSLKDEFGNIIQVNSFKLEFKKDAQINLKDFTENTNIEANIDFNIRDFKRLRRIFPEFYEILDFDGVANGSILVSGGSESGKAKIDSEIKNLSRRGSAIADNVSISSFLSWDKSGTSIKINKIEFARDNDNACIEGIIKVPNNNADLSEIITENLRKLNLTINIENLDYYSKLFNTELPAGKTEISLVSIERNQLFSQHHNIELGVLSLRIQDFTYFNAKIDSFRLNASLYRDSISVTEFSAETKAGILQGSLNGNFANKNRIAVVFTEFEYLYDLQRMKLSQEVDITIEGSKILFDSVNIVGDLGELSFTALVLLEDEYIDYNLSATALDGTWLRSILSKIIEIPFHFDELSLKSSFEGNFTDFEGNIHAEIKKVQSDKIPDFDLSFNCSGNQDVITFSDIYAFDNTKVQKTPLIRASAELPVNIFSLIGVHHEEIRIFGLDKIFARGKLDLNNLDWLRLIIPDAIRPSGQCQADFDIGGTFAIPTVNVTLTLEKLDFSDVDEAEFEKYFNINSHLTQNNPTNNLRNFKDCSIDMEIVLANKLIDVSNAEFNLQYEDGSKKKTLFNDSIKLSGTLNLLGELSQVLLMQDKFRIGEGRINLAGELSEVSSFPIISNLLTTLEGVLEFNFSVSSPWVAPNFTGFMKLHHGNAQFLSGCTPITDLSIRFEFDERQMYMINLNGYSGGAKLKGEGVITLTDTNVNLNLNLFGSSILLTRSETQTFRANVDLKILGNFTKPIIRGNLKLVDSNYSAYFNLFDELNVLDVKQTEGILRNSDIFVRITTIDKIIINTDFIKGKASSNLLVSGSLMDFDIKGRISISDANLEFPEMSFYYPTLNFDFIQGSPDVSISGNGSGSEFGYSVEMVLAGKIGKP
ncbi:MAG: hypothetical protein K8S87_09140 [Planctomycetes bacterium]|nr:hypothetical protein [Planctomycetota bacterium]